jgi:hypothetical protein
VSVGMTKVRAWLGGPFARECQKDGHSSVAMQGGEQAVHPELELAVDRCSEVQRWDFNPMLVEVEACRAKRSPQAGRTCQAVSEVAQAVDLCLSSPDKFCWAKPHQGPHSWSRSRLTSPPSRKVQTEAA